MTIHPHDHVLRYRFESDTRPDIAHVVDLGANDGFGECSCEDFVYRIQPAIRAKLPNTQRCKHLVAAREHLLNQVIARITETEFTP